jgi:hypothetical protein
MLDLQNQERCKNENDLAAHDDVPRRLPDLASPVPFPAPVRNSFSAALRRSPDDGAERTLGIERTPDDEGLTPAGVEPGRRNVH